MNDHKEQPSRSFPHRRAWSSICGFLLLAALVRAGADDLTTLGWNASTGAAATAYKVYITTPTGLLRTNSTAALTNQVQTLTPGRWTFTVTGVNASGESAKSLSVTLDVPQPQPPPPPTNFISALPARVQFNYLRRWRQYSILPRDQTIRITVSNAGTFQTHDNSPFYDSTTCYSSPCPSGTLIELKLRPHADWIRAAAVGSYSAALTVRAAGCPDLIVPVTLSVLNR
jgi:hypothetical protein